MYNRINDIFIGIFLGKVAADTKYEFVINFLLKIRTELLYLKLLIIYLTIFLFVKFQIDTFWIKIQWFLDVVILKLQWFLSDCVQLNEANIRSFFAYWEGVRDGIAISVILSLVIYIFSINKKRV